jgi:lipopolysaccharide transport system permease protein
MERVDTKALEHHELAAAATAQRRPTVVVRPSSGWSAIDFRELWSYRDLLLILAGRDVKLRYKQTALGVAWVILQPLTAALIFAVIFGRFAKLPSGGIPYILFVFCGLLAWNLFAGILQRAGNSLIGDARLISKVYFPRLLIPLASTGAVLVDFVVALAVLAILMPIYHTGLSWQVLALPGLLALTVLGAAGLALWISALNVQYRDFMYALPFIIQVWLFATPVAYAGTLIPPEYRWAYSLNPAVGYVEGFRWALLGRSTLSVSMTLITAAVTLIAFVSGAFFFRRIERGFADAI